MRGRAYQFQASRFEWVEENILIPSLLVMENVHTKNIFEKDFTILMLTDFYYWEEIQTLICTVNTPNKNFKSLKVK